MPIPVGLGSTLKLIARHPLEILLVFGINLLARIKTIFFRKQLYRNLGPNELPSETVLLILEHVSLEHTPTYKAWDEQTNPDLRLWRRYIAWAQHIGKTLVKDRDLFEQLKRFDWGDFTALSYAWGPSDPKRYIILNGRFFQVNPNLEAALRASRVQFDPRIGLWVDALCINQDDLEERGVQVRRMRELYGGAIHILIHLGTEPNDLGMRGIRRIAENMKKGFDWRNYFFHMATNMEDSKLNDERDTFVAVFKLLVLPYWTRMWIIQELAMGQDHICCSGNEWVPLADIRQVLKLLVLNIDSLSTLVPQDLLEKHMRDFQSTIGTPWWIGRARELTMLPPNREDFTYAEIRSPILSLSQSANATDPRDKVYGLLGLLPNKLASRLDLKDKNYAISTHAVFLKFAKTIIQVTNELDIIFARNFRQSEDSELQLPSWATDWTLKPIRTTGVGNANEWYFGVEEGYETVEESNKIIREWNGEANAFHSDGGRKPIITFSDNNKLISCEGFCIGRADGMAAESPSATTMSSTPDRFIKPTTDQTLYANTSDTTNAILRTLGLDPSGEQTKDSGLFHVPWFGAEADSDANGEYGAFNMSTEYSNHYFGLFRERGWEQNEFLGSFFSFEFARRNLGMRFFVNHKPFKDYFPDYVPQRPEKTDFNIFRTVVANLIGRRLITTQTGHVGMAPATIELADKIYILVGSSMPVVLRPSGEYYEVVGECYVDGFMKGEAMEGLDAGKYELESITIC
ncbi:hypothetical protein HYALB_00008632 [Hymenoscyphus albidus]|uniref:Heterokaryon incompatibility domain-containing protein n=1 Tax=Hymenoscyphus albidus TaxID=595503 RepID=A0A9N9LHA9_9HELO|nr:hypothetical protein HYALB_00008632 [Hymenoscyphus albidus]